MDFIASDVDDKRPPKEWWDTCTNTIQKKNPDYTDEQIRKTCGHLWYHQKIKKKIHDFMVGDAISLRSWWERWKKAHFYAPDTHISTAATAGKKTSSNVDWIGYDEKRLRVRFKEKTSKKTGKVYPASMYEYDVEPKFHTYMAGAPSKGKFVWNYLRGRVPGRVIDKPWKMTPGGVGGSIVPYSKESPRRIPKREMKRVQKLFAKEIERGTKLIEQSRVRARKIMKERKIEPITAGQKAFIERLEKKYRKDLETNDLDLNVIHQYPYNIQRAIQMFLNIMRWKLKDIEDVIVSRDNNITIIDKQGKRHSFSTDFQDFPVQGHYRTLASGKKVWVPEFSKKGEAKKAILEKIKRLQKTPLPEPPKKKKKRVIAALESPRQKKARKELKIEEPTEKFYWKRCSKCGERFMASRTTETKCPACRLEQLKIHYGMGPGVSERELKRKDFEIEDYAYISVAVDKCAKERVGEHKEEYDKAVEECIKIIGIQRREAGLQPRGRGTPREERRLERRQRVQERITERRERAERAEERRRQQQLQRVRAGVREARQRRLEERRRSREEEQRRREREEQERLQRQRQQYVPIPSEEGGEGRIIRIGHWRTLRSGRRIWVNPVRAGTTTRRGAETQEQARERMRSSAERERRARRLGRRRRWDVDFKAYSGGREINDPADFDPSNFDSFSFYIKDQYGDRIGYADFDQRSYGAYLEYFITDREYRGQGVGTSIMTQALPFIDRHNFTIRGEAVPINRNPPVGLTLAQENEWWEGQARELRAMYRRFGGEAEEAEVRGRRGLSMVRYPHPERILGTTQQRERARARDMIIEDITKKMRGVPEFPEVIELKELRNIFEFDGELFYYDPEGDLYYYLIVKKKKTKNRR